MPSTLQATHAIEPIMTAFDTEKLLAPRASTADEGAIIKMTQKMRALRARGEDVVSLTLGEPDFDTPDNIQHAATEAMRVGLTHYSPVQGIPELREAISRKLKQENGLTYSPTEIVMTNGAKQAIANAILSLIDVGDEVIILAPYWVSYEITVRFAGGTPIILRAGVEENFKVPAMRIAEAITARTKLLILNSPSNPTGALWTEAEFEEIARIARGHNTMMVLSDEIYEYIIFEGRMASIGALPGMRERTITVNGFSKSFAMTGWRLGYAAAVEPVARAMTRMQSTITTGANTFVQHAALAALQGPRESVEYMRERYKARRDLVQTGLSAIQGLKLAPIPSTFYAFPDVSAYLGKRAGNHVIDSVDTLCDWLLEHHGVATVPGSAFGNEQCIRLSFATSEENIEKALARLGKAFASLS
jgi:aspartate aminotransferase